MEHESGEQNITIAEIAKRAGVSTVLIPAGNEADLDEIDQSVRHCLRFITADHVDAIIDVALNRAAVEQQVNAVSVPPQGQADSPRIGQ